MSGLCSSLVAGGLTRLRGALLFAVRCLFAASAADCRATCALNLFRALCESVLLSCSESVLLSCSNSPSWPSRSRCLGSVVTHVRLRMMQFPACISSPSTAGYTVPTLHSAETEHATTDSVTAPHNWAARTPQSSEASRVARRRRTMPPGDLRTDPKHHHTSRAAAPQARARATVKACVHQHVLYVSFLRKREG